MLSALVALAVLHQPAPPPRQDYQQLFVELAAKGQQEAGENFHDIITPLGPRLRAVADLVGWTWTDAAGEKHDMEYTAAGDPGAQAPHRELAKTALDAFGAEGFFLEIRRMAAATRAVPRPQEGLLLDLMAPWLGTSRHIARINAGRMQLALSERDTRSFLDRAEENLAIGVHAARNPNAISYLVGTAIHALTWEKARRAIAEGYVDDPAARRLEAMLERHRLPSPSLAVRGERLMACDVVDLIYWTGPAGLTYLRNFGSENAVRPAYPATPVIAEGSGLGGGLPSRLEQVAVTDRFYGGLAQLAGMNRAQRARAEFTLADASALAEGNLVLDLLDSGLTDRFMRTIDQSVADAAGLRVIIALERHRLARGVYPEALAELTPAFLASVPSDPFTGGPLGYLPPSGAPYVEGRPYILYAAGLDCTDNGGNVDPLDRIKANREGGNGLDFLLNDAVSKGGKAP